MTTKNKETKSAILGGKDMTMIAENTAASSTTSAKSGMDSYLFNEPPPGGPTGACQGDRAE